MKTKTEIIDYLTVGKKLSFLKVDKNNIKRNYTDVSVETILKDELTGNYIYSIKTLDGVVSIKLNEIIHVE